MKLSKCDIPKEILPVVRKLQRRSLYRVELIKDSFYSLLDGNFDFLFRYLVQVTHFYKESIRLAIIASSDDFKSYPADKDDSYLGIRYEALVRYKFIPVPPRDLPMHINNGSRLLGTCMEELFQKGQK